ncbi:TRAP transporter substrate-binding protein DctP [Budvicia diplopodorum]|uniref:TRAP transporter substrate-binding protein DctP n=1 Tax=Budvicia diplopodorum TaxID=1119056 RepID=UPI0013572248|nr:TRAP transporter substrate-binding protein DctP [Budvicia diplopodorum]
MKLLNAPLALMLAMFLLPTTVSATTTLRYTDHEPLGGMRTRFIKDVFFTAIEKQSNGRLKIEEHWNGGLAVGYDALRVIGDGSAADMGIVVPEYTADKLPLHQIFKSFPVGPSGDKQIEFFKRVYAEIPAFPAELKKENVVNIFFGTGYPVAFFGTRPLKNLEDIKGTKWRSASFWHQDFLRNAGATPLTMPWGPETVNAFKSGALDGIMVNIDSGYDLKVQEMAPNVLVSNELWLGHVYLLVMNKETWDKLAQEDKEAIQRAAKIAYKTAGSVMDNALVQQIDTLRKSGAKVRALQHKEVEHWQDVTRYQEIQAKWVKKQEALNVKDVSPTMEKVSNIMSDVMK